MKNSEILEQAKAVIVDPNCWTQGVMARDLSGLSVTDPREGVCFCSVGAIARVTGLDNYSFRAEALLTSSIEGIPKSVSHFNDNHTHGEVMELFDKAIELAKEEEAAKESRTP